MTIYRMYAQNGNRAGFWVQHRGWENTCALVLSVGGRAVGPLPGRAPLHGGAEVTVRRYDVRSGRLLATGVRLDEPGDKNFAFIAEPSWSRAGQGVGGGPPERLGEAKPHFGAEPHFAATEAT